jgi:hypothetical protein
MYRTISYVGETLKALEKRIKEILDRKEEIITFRIDTYETERIVEKD